VKLERKDSGVLVTWSANSEPDLAGYNIYRTDAGGPSKRNTNMVRETRFFDEAPGPAPYVSYYVTAVDKAGNESDRSQEMTIILKE
jgi:fibronectin type 3 domain-containing protein